MRGQPHISRDLVCKGIVNRLHAGRYGGVACYARKWLAPYVTCVLERREHGLMWLKVAKESGLEKDLYMAIVYLPHEESTFFSTLPYRSFIDDIECDILRFSAVGSVMLTGDFNSRTGSLIRLPEDGNNDQLRGAGIEHISDLATRVQRVSEDTTVNAWGEELLRLCARHNLYIANGVQGLRSSGDHTYQSSPAGDGQIARQSVIDYFILPHDILCSMLQSNRGGLSIIPLRDCPRTHNDVAFDHKPVNLVLLLANKIQRLPRARPESGVVKILWRGDLREPYVDHLRSDGNALQLLQQVGLEESSLAEANDALNALIWHSVQYLQSTQGRVLVKAAGSQSESSNGQHQSWYTLECARKRRELKRVERRVGDMRHVEVVRLRKEYRQLVKKSKAEYEERQTREMYANAFKDPRKFYRMYKKQSCTTAPFTIQECQDHFVNLLQGDASTQYVRGSVEEHCRTHEALFGAPTQEMLDSACVLNDVVSAHEVVGALKAMQAGKAAGPDGVPNELFSSAYWVEFFQNSEGRLVPIRHYIFGEALARMFTKVLRSGEYPESWAVAALVPVPKPKSSGLTIDDYRGIAVGNAIGKIYAKVIMNRLDTWAERQGHRAVSQFGFRGEVGTLEAAFVLRHMVETCVAAQSPLYTAFIDFRKAYDRVDRELLWKMLQKLGVHGECLRTLKAMYETVLLQVRFNGEMGEPFISQVGVK